MKRREFITLLGGGTAAWPLVAHAQQAVMPVIGFLNAGSLNSGSPFMAVFRRTLREAGYVEHQNVVIEERYADGQYERLPDLAAELIRLQVKVIITAPNNDAARAAKAATDAIPIIFMVTDDPVKLGLVNSLSRPGGNATGINFLISELATKRLGLLRALLPSAARFAALVNPNALTTEGFIKDVEEAASAIGIPLEIACASNSFDIEAAFATLAQKKVDALMVAPDTLFVSRRVQMVTFAMRYAIPTIYTVRQYVETGGLMSYGPSAQDAYHQLAIYAGRILRGERTDDLPVVQSTKVELVINMPTARALGLTVPPSLLAIADEVIE